MAYTVEIIAAGSGRQTTYSDVDEVVVEASAETAQDRINTRVPMHKLLVINWENTAGLIIEDVP
jgi:hypothetical protein